MRALELASSQVTDRSLVQSGEIATYPGAGCPRDATQPGWSDPSTPQFAGCPNSAGVVGHQASPHRRAAATGRLDCAFVELPSSPTFLTAVRIREPPHHEGRPSPDGLNHYWQAVERQSILTVTQVHPESLRMLSTPVNSASRPLLLAMNDYDAYRDSRAVCLYVPERLPRLCSRGINFPPPRPQSAPDILSAASADPVSDRGGCTPARQSGLI